MAVQDNAPIWVVTRAGVAADTVLCQLRTAPLVRFMTWMTPAYEAAESRREAALLRVRDLGAIR